MARSPLTVLVLCALTALAVVAFTRRGAAEGEAYGLRFISISGDGSSTKAWFEGAPPTGTRVGSSRNRQRICQTRADWEQQAREAQEALRVRDSGVCSPGECRGA